MDSHTAACRCIKTRREIATWNRFHLQNMKVKKKKLKKKKEKEKENYMTYGLPQDNCEGTKYVVQIALEISGDIPADRPKLKKRYVYPKKKDLPKHKTAWYGST